MAENHQQIQFSAFLGANEGMHSLLLPDIFSPGGSLNLWLDKFGRAKRISGYEKRTGSPLVTNVGGSSTIVRNLFPYRKTAGGSVSRQVIAVLDDGVDEWELWKSTDDGASFTFLLDLGASSINTIADFAQFGDNLYITNGVMAPRKYDGTTVSSAGETQSPTITSAAGAAGNLTGTYQWKLVSIKTDGTRKAGSVASTILRLTAKQASLSWTADADTDVKGYELYRTLSTDGYYYYVTYIDGRTTAAYTDNAVDSGIFNNRSLEEHGDPPVTAIRYVEPHKQRLWWLGTPTNPTRGYWSDAGRPESVWSGNYLDFSDADTQGDTIVGGSGNFHDALAVFTERAVWMVSGTGALLGTGIVDWNRKRSNASIGAVSTRSVLQVTSGSKYTDQFGQLQTVDTNCLAYFTPNGDVRLFDGDSDIIISSPMSTTLADFYYTQRGKVHAEHDAEHFHMTWYVPTNSSSEPNIAITWNYRWGVWYKSTPQPFASACAIETAGDSNVILLGSNSASTGGYVYTGFSGNSFDGSAIQSQWMTKAIRGLNQEQAPDVSHRKRWRWIDLLLQVASNAPILVEWVRGMGGDTAAAFGSKTVSGVAGHLVTANGSTILTANGSSIAVSAQSALIRVLLNTAGEYLHDESMRLRIGDNSTNASWAIEGVTVDYQQLPGLQRRDQ